jgi:hypothetical protein
MNLKRFNTDLTKKLFFTKKNKKIAKNPTFLKIIIIIIIKIVWKLLR